MPAEIGNNCSFNMGSCCTKSNYNDPVSLSGMIAPMSPYMRETREIAVSANLPALSSRQSPSLPNSAKLSHRSSIHRPSNITSHLKPEIPKLDLASLSLERPQVQDDHTHEDIEKRKQEFRKSKDGPSNDSRKPSNSKHRNLLALVKPRSLQSSVESPLPRKEAEKIQTQPFVYTQSNTLGPGFFKNSSMSPNNSVERSASPEPIRRMHSSLLQVDQSFSSLRSSQVSTLRPDAARTKKTRPVVFTTTIEKVKLRGNQSQLNQYRVMKFLGKGAFGKVYKVEDTEGQHFAMKVYSKRVLRHRWVGKGRTMLHQVQNEIKIMEGLENPHIVELIEVIDNENSGKIYLIIEYMSGGVLSQVCPMSEEKARPYFQQLIQGLHYLHETASVVHRDIKPQNLLLDSVGNLRISDFGASQPVNKLTDIINYSAGTYAFMAPELMGSAKEFRGKPLDMWAAGITLYFMLEGTLPYQSKHFVDLSNEVRDFELIIPAKYSHSLRHLLVKLLDKDPDMRLTVAQVKDDEWLKS